MNKDYPIFNSQSQTVPNDTIKEIILLNNKIYKEHIERVNILPISNAFYSKILFDDLCSSDTYLKNNTACKLDKFKGILYKVRLIK